MIKKFSSIILLNLLAVLFFISCSASIVDSTQPLSNEEIIGNGDVIEQNKDPEATTDPSIISEFLQNHRISLSKLLHQKDGGGNIISVKEITCRPE